MASSSDLIGWNSACEGRDSAAPTACPRVPCSFYGSLIVPPAALCGFRWHGRNDPATAKSGFEK